MSATSVAWVPLRGPAPASACRRKVRHRRTQPPGPPSLARTNRTDRRRAVVAAMASASGVRKWSTRALQRLCAEVASGAAASRISAERARNRPPRPRRPGGQHVLQLGREDLDITGREQPTEDDAPMRSRNSRRKRARHRLLERRPPRSPSRASRSVRRNLRAEVEVMMIMAWRKAAARRAVAQALVVQHLEEQVEMRVSLPNSSSKTMIKARGSVRSATSRRACSPLSTWRGAAGAGMAEGRAGRCAPRAEQGIRERLGDLVDPSLFGRRTQARACGARRIGQSGGDRARTDQTHRRLRRRSTRS